VAFRSRKSEVRGQLARVQLPLINSRLPSIGKLHSGLPGWKVLRIARHQQTIFGHRACPNDRIGQLEPIFSPQLDRFLRYVCRQWDNAKMSKKSPPDVLIALCSRAGHYLNPRNNADAALAVARNFPGRRSVAVQEVQENVAVQKRVQVRRFHSRRRTATCRETFPRVLEAPKNERKSSAGEPRRKRSTARRTASAREIFSRRQSNASFLICSLGRSTIVRTRYHRPLSLLVKIIAMCESVPASASRLIDRAAV